MRGWSQAYVAHEVGAAGPYCVSRWERGVVSPSPYYRERLCRLFGRNAEELGLIVPLPDGARLTAPHDVPGSLPSPLTPLIGRAGEASCARGLLRRDDLRLLTLTGPPGAGKTRLGLGVASELRRDFPDGVYFVDLAAVSDPDLVAAAVTRALGLCDAHEHAPDDTIASHLRERRALLVVDGFEHLLPAAPLLLRLLTRCRKLRLLVTSRAALRSRGEQELLVRPLPVPDAAEPPDPLLLGQVPSVALFVERAQARSPDFRLTPRNAVAVAAICRRLDGLPLALELAAVWTTLLDPAALLARLEQRLPMLEGGAEDLPQRQRTMRRALQWSYERLTPSERRLFRRLSVFTGSAPLAAVEAVCAAGGRLERSVLHLLGRLLDQNLVQCETGGADPRVAMLETVREYAHELLRAAGEARAAERALTRYRASSS
jgi:predicted ATPase